jgi:uncharacterized protein YbaR (Trm112 family)
MRPRLLQWLVCPLCYHELTLMVAVSERRPPAEAEYHVLEATAPIEDPNDVEIDIISGALACDACRIYYPIYNGIPRMLIYSTRVAQLHAQENRAWLTTRLAGFDPPQRIPPPGEQEVLRNFSTEWVGYKWTGVSYWSLTPDAMLRCKRYELGLGPRRDLQHRLVLEVGIGIGGTADALSQAESCELVGMDLGYAVDQARHYFGQNPLFHLVQASVFAPPFRPSSFDVVYSHGVLHHTYSTRAAFIQLARLPKQANGMLYVWVYSHNQEQATPLRRVLMITERGVRPMLSRLPGFWQTLVLVPALPFYVLYQNFYRRTRLGAHAARYGWNEALHAARDRLTPPFAHRHTYEEVIKWFQAEMYEDLELLCDERPPEGVPNTFPLNVGVRGFRRAVRESRQIVRSY